MILLFCVVIGVFLAGTYVIVYHSFVREVRRGLDERLLDAARPMIASLVAHPGEPHLADLEIKGQFLQLLGPDGHVVEQSDGGIGPKIPQEVLRQNDQTFFFTIKTEQGDLRTAIIPMVMQEQPHWFVIAESTARVDEIENSFRTRAFGLWTVSLLLTTLIAVWYVSRSLSPIVDLGRHAALLTSKASSSVHGDLNVSLPIANPTDELGILAANFNVLFARVGNVIGQLRQFVSDAAHELRTPLAVVLGETELLCSQPRSGEEYRAALKTITGELSTMARIIDGLFTLSIADAGQLGSQNERLFLDEVIQEACGIATAGARRKKIEIDYSQLAQIEYLGDQALIRQLFLILLDNAIKYSPPNTRIQVRLGFISEQPVAEVKDEGFGISRQHVPHIFKRFYRAAPQSNDEVRSGGLGLAIARAIIQAHGGEISCESDEGKGSTFRIRFASLDERKILTSSKVPVDEPKIPSDAVESLLNQKN